MMALHINVNDLSSIDSMVTALRHSAELHFDRVLIRLVKLSFLTTHS